MKKTFTLLFIPAFLSVYGQCSINGKETLNINETTTFSLDKDDAQCEDCHLWVPVGGNITIETDHKKAKIQVRTVASGKSVLSLAILTPQGLSQCSKNITIIDSKASATTTVTAVKPDCGINMTNFKELKYDDSTVTFYPNENNGNYRYIWKVTYANGESKESTEKVPQFPFTREQTIQKISVKVYAGTCMKEYTKSYDDNFWKYF